MRPTISDPSDLVSCEFTPSEVPVVERYDDLLSLMFLMLLGCQVSHRQLYQLTHRQVLRAISRVNRNRDDAAEILQDVFFTAWRRCDRYDPARGSVLSWLCTIGHRRAVDSLKHRSVRLKSTSDMTSPSHAGAGDRDSDREVCSEAIEPFEFVAQSQAATAVQASLGALAPDVRECVVLFYFEGLTHVEVAQRVDRPLGTVKAWLRRSMVTMRPGVIGH